MSNRLRTMAGLIVLSVIAGCAICGYSQSVTAGVNPAVHVSWPTTTNKAYQVQAATNLSGPWLPIGQLVEGSGGLVGSFFDATSARQFFRVQPTNSSGITWLEGVWVGRIFQAGGGASTFSLQIAITNSNRSFTAAIYDISIPNLPNATARLDLLSYGDNQARFYWVTLTGSTVNGPVYLTKINTTNILYNWSLGGDATGSSSFGSLTNTVPK